MGRSIFAFFYWFHNCRGLLRQFGRSAFTAAAGYLIGGK